MLYAGFWFRVVAVIIDYMILLVGSVLLSLALGFIVAAFMIEYNLTQVDVDGFLYNSGAFLGIFLRWIYFTAFESSKWMASPGKKALGITVVDMKGNRIGFGRANARYWSCVLSLITFGVGYLLAAFTNKKRALHDFIGGTLVIRLHAADEVSREA